MAKGTIVNGATPEDVLAHYPDLKDKVVLRESFNHD